MFPKVNSEMDYAQSILTRAKSSHRKKNMMALHVEAPAALIHSLAGIALKHGLTMGRIVRVLLEDFTTDYHRPGMVPGMRITFEDEENQT